MFMKKITFLFLLGFISLTFLIRCEKSSDDSPPLGKGHTNPNTDTLTYHDFCFDVYVYDNLGDPVQYAIVRWNPVNGFPNAVAIPAQGTTDNKGHLSQCLSFPSNISSYTLDITDVYENILDVYVPWEGNDSLYLDVNKRPSLTIHLSII
jgi:hypothetical protein